MCTGLAVAVVGTILYAVGGDDGSDTFYGVVEAFDTVTQTWSADLPSMPTARTGFGLGVAGTTLYAVGGVGDANVPLGTVEAFDTVTQTWTTGLPAMPTPRFDLAAAMVGGTTLYAVGGTFNLEQGSYATVEALHGTELLNCTFEVLDPLAPVSTADAVANTTALTPEFSD